MGKKSGENLYEDKETAKVTSLLQIKNFSYHYTRQEVWNKLSFSLDPGEIVLLRGPNGAGKSTLLRTLAGWDLPSAGTMWLEGEQYHSSRRTQRRLIAFVSDTPSFYDDLTAAEHLNFVLRANHLTSDKRANYLMHTLGLERYRDQFPSAYSRGMRQKLALVLALLIRPRLLLLDEPYGPLDDASSRALSTLLQEEKAIGMAALISCHHEAPGLKVDRVLNLEEGCLSVSREA